MEAEPVGRENGIETVPRCLVCGGPSPAEPEPIPGLKGEAEAIRERVCSPACAGEARRFAARRSAQLGPARAGLAVAALGVATAAAFLATGRDMGRALLVLSLFGLGTSRLAYPDAVPLGLARAVGLVRATTLLQWAGVLLASSAVILAAVFLLA